MHPFVDREVLEQREAERLCSRSENRVALLIAQQVTPGSRNCVTSYHSFRLWWNPGAARPSFGRSVMGSPLVLVALALSSGCRSVHSKWS